MNQYVASAGLKEGWKEVPDYNSNGRRYRTEGQMEEGAGLNVRMGKGAGLNVGWTELPD